MDYEKLASELLKYQVGIQHHPKDEHVRELSKGEMAVIAYLTEICDTVTPGCLSTQCNVSTARIANTLNSLEKKGFVIRMMDAQDRRKILVQITEKGKAYGMEKRKNAMQGLTSLLEDLGEEDAREYVRIMRKIYDLTRRQIEEGKENG